MLLGTPSGCGELTSNCSFCWRVINLPCIIYIMKDVKASHTSLIFIFEEPHGYKGTLFVPKMKHVLSFCVFQSMLR